MPTIAVFNQKGGFGKTTAGLNLVAGLALARCNPVAIDLDPQGHLSLAYFAQNVPPPQLMRRLAAGLKLIGALSRVRCTVSIFSSFHHKVPKRVITAC